MVRVSSAKLRKGLTKRKPREREREREREEKWGG
jgi:hypothetical protein